MANDSVALGRALIRRPKVLLMDEPLSNLDAELRHQMRHEIRRLHDELGRRRFTSARPNQAMTLADRVAILDKGVLQQHARPCGYREPANEFVQSFLCRHLDDLVETANTLLRPSEEGLDVHSYTHGRDDSPAAPRGFTLVANDAEATNGRRVNSSRSPTTATLRRWNWLRMELGEPCR